MDIPWLVVSTPLKNISQNGNDSPIYIYIHILWKIKFMFETTNQNYTPKYILVGGIPTL